MKVEDFDYPLPRDRIALEPVSPRDASRLLVLNRKTGEREHRRFHDLPEYLRSGDALVLNDTRVLPARIVAHRTTGGRVKALLVERVKDRVWHALLDTSRKLQIGEELRFDDEITAKLAEKTPDGRWVLEFSRDIGPEMRRLGVAPLPPYIKREATEKDLENYQTVYSEHEGAIAAPTAGLHFTSELLKKIEDQGVLIRRVTLHVGLGTFKPVKCENVEDHRMEGEVFGIPSETRESLEGRRVVAVGTTSVRTLETWARSGKTEGTSELFIYPGFEFKVVDALVTNFHVPKSTLLMLVSAFAGREKILEAYGEAVEMGYRFYSYGDAMLIL